MSDLVTEMHQNFETDPMYPEANRHCPVCRCWVHGTTVESRISTHLLDVWNASD